jgi:hypothetical protein
MSEPGETYLQPWVVDETPRVNTAALSRLLRETLDTRQLYSTEDSRVVTITRLCLSSELESDDPTLPLMPYVVSSENLLEWYKIHKARIALVANEDPTRKTTDRYYLERDIDPYRKGRWLKNFNAVRLIEPHAREVHLAGILLKVIIEQAHWQRSDDVTQAAKMVSKNSPSTPAA